MRVTELFSRIRNTLQDHDKDYWDDSELLSYYNECKMSMAAERLENRTTATLTLDPTRNTYNTDGVLRYIRAVDNNGLSRKLYPDDESGVDDLDGIIVRRYNEVYVNNPSNGTVITLSIVAMPNEDNLDSTVRIGDEEAMTYYILSKAYEKDSDMENFQKSSYFLGRYNDILKRLSGASNSNYKTSVTETVISYSY